MKKLFVLQFLLCLLFAKPVGAYDFYIDYDDGVRIYYNDVSINEFAKKCEVVSGDYRYSGELVIPDSAGIYEVVGIGPNAFNHNDGLTKITLPSNLQYIRTGAFYLCAGLKEIILPDNLQEIYSNAFQYCVSLDSIYLSRGLVEIGGGAFGSSNINSINIPCCDVAGNAFNACEINKLTIERNLLTGSDTINFNGNVLMPISLNINCSFKGIDFSWLGKNKKTIEVSYGSNINDDKKISIPANAFKGCSALKDLYLGENVIDIGDRAFMDCTSLDTLILPSKITAIQDSVFMNCNWLTKVEMPNSITKIGKSAFRNCTRLDSLYLSRGLELIDEYAFNRALLTKLNIPCCNTGDDAFTGCTIRYLTIEKNPVTGCDSIPNFHSNVKETMYSINIPNCKIPKTFWYSKFLSSVSIGDNSKNNSSKISIPENAFARCELLKEIFIGKNVISISKDAFAYSLYRDVTISWSDPSDVVGYIPGSSKINLHVPAGTSAKYKSAPYWEKFNIIEDFIPGDVNNDSVVNVTDAIGIVNYILKNTPATFIETAADVNEDGTINVTDAIGVVNKILNIDSGAKFNYVREKSFVEPQ